MIYFSDETNLASPSVQPLKLTVRATDEDYIIAYDDKEHMFKTANFDMIEDNHIVDQEAPSSTKSSIENLEELFEKNKNPKFNKIQRSIATCVMENKIHGKEKVQVCIQKSLSPIYNKLETEMYYIKQHIEQMAFKLRNYTCADDDLDTTTPIRSFQVTKNSITHTYSTETQTDTIRPVKTGINTETVNVHLNTTHANIWTIEEFISQEECDTLMKFGSTRLTRATVAADDGSSIVSYNRKAQQASYDTYREKNDPIG